MNRVIRIFLTLFLNILAAATLIDGTTKIASENEQNLVWMGAVTTGYNPDVDSILELGFVITDSQLNIIAQSPFLIVKPETAQEIEVYLLNFLKQCTKSQPFLLGRDRIMRERLLLRKQMPILEAYFSPVTMNCFSIREFCKLWNLEVYQRDSALDTAYEAIAEAQFYKEKYFSY